MEEITEMVKVLSILFKLNMALEHQDAHIGICILAFEDSGHRILNLELKSKTCKKMAELLLGYLESRWVEMLSDDFTKIAAFLDCRSKPKLTVSQACSLMKTRFPERNYL